MRNVDEQKTDFDEIILSSPLKDLRSDYQAETLLVSMQVIFSHHLINTDPLKGGVSPSVATQSHKVQLPQCEIV